MLNPPGPLGTRQLNRETNRETNGLDQPGIGCNPTTNTKATFGVLPTDLVRTPVVYLIHNKSLLYRTGTYLLSPEMTLGPIDPHGSCAPITLI